MSQGCLEEHLAGARTKIGLSSPCAADSATASLHPSGRHDTSHSVFTGMSVSSVLGSPPRRGSEPGADRAGAATNSRAPAWQATAARASPDSDLSDFELRFPGESPECASQAPPDSALPDPARLGQRRPEPLAASRPAQNADTFFVGSQRPSVVAGLVPSAPTDDVGRLRGSVSSLAVALRRQELLCEHWRAEADAARAEAAASREEATAQSHRARAAEEDSAWLRAAADELGAQAHGQDLAHADDDELDGRARGWASVSPGLAAEPSMGEPRGPQLLGSGAPARDSDGGCEAGASAVLQELRGAAVEALRLERDEAVTRLQQVQDAADAARQASSMAVAAARAESTACRVELDRLNAETAQSTILHGARLREAASARTTAEHKAAEAETALRAAVVGRCRAEAALVGAQRELAASAAHLARSATTSAKLSERLRLAEAAVDELHGRTAAAEVEAGRWRDATSGLEERLAALTGVRGVGRSSDGGTCAGPAATPAHPGPAAHRTIAVMENLRRSLRSAQQELLASRDVAKAWERHAAESDAAAAAARAELDALRAARRVSNLALAPGATSNHVEGIPVVAIAVAQERETELLRRERAEAAASAAQARTRAGDALGLAIQTIVTRERNQGLAQRLGRCAVESGLSTWGAAAATCSRRRLCALTSQLATSCGIRPRAVATPARGWAIQSDVARATMSPGGRRWRNLESCCPLEEAVLPSSPQAATTLPALASTGTQTVGRVFASDDVGEAVRRALHSSRRRMSVVQAKLEIERSRQVVSLWDSETWSDLGQPAAGSIVQATSPLRQLSPVLNEGATSPKPNAPQVPATHIGDGSSYDEGVRVPSPMLTSRSGERRHGISQRHDDSRPGLAAGHPTVHSPRAPLGGGGTSAGVRSHGRPRDLDGGEAACGRVGEPQDWASSLPTFGNVGAAVDVAVGWAPLVRL